MNKRMKLINKITKIGIFTALSIVLYNLKFPLPFFPPFLEVNFSMLPIILVSLMFGPIEGALVVLIRFLIKLPFTHTVIVGETADLIIGLLTVVPTSLIYQLHRSKKGGVIALIVTFFIWTIAGALSNFFTVPLYVKYFFGGDVEAIVRVLTTIPGINASNYLWKYFIFAALPFNALLSFVICLTTFFLYKHISKIFKHDFFKDSTNTKKVMVMIDSFKGTITSREANKIVKDKLIEKGYVVDTLSISDGGEGFVDSISEITKLKILTTVTYDALFRKHNARYLYDKKTKTAYVELAECCGIASLKHSELDPYKASSYGLGYMINYIVKNHKVNKIVIGIGGSASSDGGCGMLEALGTKFYNQQNQEITKMNNEKIKEVVSIDFSQTKELLKGIIVEVLTDVSNPLTGPNGAVYVFSKQKGATPDDMVVLEKNMMHLKNIIENDNKCIKKNENGEGAAGGVGFAFNRIIGATLNPGVNTILKLVNFSKICQEYDEVITGEGCLDEQTLNGKVIKGIMEYKPKRLILIVGSAKIKVNECDVYPVVPTVCSLEESLTNPIECFVELIDKIKEEL